MDYNENIKLAEWRFNEYTEPYDEFFLDNENSEGFEGWLQTALNMISTRLSLIPVKETASKTERRYEVIEKDSPFFIHIRILTVPAGNRLEVYSRGAEWLFNDAGKTVKIRYYGYYRDFCLKMARHWGKPLSNDYRKESELYPENHSFWHQMVKVPSRPYIEYETGKVYLNTKEFKDPIEPPNTSNKLTPSGPSMQIRPFIEGKGGREKIPDAEIEHYKRALNWRNELPGRTMEIAMNEIAKRDEIKDYEFDAVRIKSIQNRIRNDKKNQEKNNL